MSDKTDSLKRKHDEQEEEMKKHPFSIKSAISAKRKHKKDLEEGAKYGFKNRGRGK